MLILNPLTKIHAKKVNSEKVSYDFYYCVQKYSVSNFAFYDTHIEFLKSQKLPEPDHCYVL
jgi:hypothetical protein